MTGTTRWKSGQSSDVGAYELLMAPYRSLGKPGVAGVFSVCPNPVASGHGQLLIKWDEATTSERVAQLFGPRGQFIRAFAVPKGATELLMSVQGLPPGNYLLWLQGYLQAVGVVVF